LNQLTPEYEMYGDSMRYGRAIKESVLKRVLPPNAESIRSVSVDVRIAEQTIRNWIAKVDQGILGDDVQLGPRQLGAPEKFALLLEAAGLKEDERGTAHPSIELTRRYRTINLFRREICPGGER
jgi:transposase-like protein